MRGPIYDMITFVRVLIIKSRLLGSSFRNGSEERCHINQNRIVKGSICQNGHLSGSVKS